VQNFHSSLTMEGSAMPQWLPGIAQWGLESGTFSVKAFTCRATASFRAPCVSVTGKASLLTVKGPALMQGNVWTGAVYGGGAS
jgi:hypothetical protein